MKLPANVLLCVVAVMFTGTTIHWAVSTVNMLYELETVVSSSGLPCVRGNGDQDCSPLVLQPSSHHQLPWLYCARSAALTVNVNIRI